LASHPDHLFFRLRLFMAVLLVARCQYRELERFAHSARDPGLDLGAGRGRLSRPLSLPGMRSKTVSFLGASPIRSACGFLLPIFLGWIGLAIQYRQL
jgi:hypothetical protein